MPFNTGEDARKALNKKKKLYQRKGQDSKFKDSKACMSLPPSKVNAYAVPGVPKFTHRKGSGLECTCTCKKHLRNDKQHIATLRERVQFYKAAAKFEKAAHKQTVKECCEYHVDARPISGKPYASQSEEEQAQTLTITLNAIAQVHAKMRLTDSEFNLITAYYLTLRGFGTNKQTTTSPDSIGLGQPTTASPSQPKTPTEGHRGRTNIWDDEWEKLHLLRGIADELVVSAHCLRRVFLVLGKS